MKMVLQSNGDVRIRFEGYDLLELCEYSSAPVRGVHYPDCTYIAARSVWHVEGLCLFGNNDPAFLDMRGFLRSFIEGGALTECLQTAGKPSELRLGFGEMMDRVAKLELLAMRSKAVA